MRATARSSCRPPAVSTKRLPFAECSSSSGCASNHTLLEYHRRAQSAYQYMNTGACGFFSWTCAAAAIIFASAPVSFGAE